MATSGAGQAIYFNEEMHAPVSVGRLVIGIVVITVLFELIPVIGIVIGTTHLPTVFASEAPFTAFLAERALPLVAMLVTLGITAALLNAVVTSRSGLKTGRRDWRGKQALDRQAEIEWAALDRSRASRCIECIA